ncbi:hypothetical protein PVAND_014228 [Polypedilum vanderplanki]|uniref:Ionotropic receptor n=1 Tax=Polypedilum vanderplanki TaxID=319348 RepID=A0A9J6CS43_POLVA|nr:hypothetical protein PVAND_014228 [Polypedilum vanderplanki]
MLTNIFKFRRKTFISNFFNFIFFIFILCIKFLQISSLNSENQENSIEKSINPDAKAIVDVIKKFYIDNDIEFDLIVYGKSSHHINDLINVIGENEIPTTLIQVLDINNWHHLINNSAVIFVESFENFLTLQNKSVNEGFLLNGGPQKLKFLIYIEEINDFKELKKVISEFAMPTFFYPADLRYFEYFLIEDKNFVNLSANVIYTEGKCENFQPKLLNSFDKHLLKWVKELEDFDPYDNFHGCMVNFIVSLDDITIYIENNLEVGYDKFSTDEQELYEILANENVKFGGLIPELLKIMTASKNFTIHYTVISSNQSKFEFLGMNNFLPNYLGTFSFMPSDPDYKTEIDHFSLPFRTEDNYYLISYTDTYTNFEKMLFPFDLTTWLLILFTFGLTFGTILGLKFSSEWVETLIIGRGIQSPAYNALGIFFGISQLKLPKEIFCRAILIIYIWFCLMIRIYWQSMMFEFMTTDMRKPMPESIEDLYEMNFTIMESMMDHLSFIGEHISKGRKKEYVVVSSGEFKYFYGKALEEDLLKKYVFLVSFEVHHKLNQTFKSSLLRLKNEKVTYMTRLALTRNNILLHSMNHFMDKLIPAGIACQLMDYASWHDYRLISEEIDDPRKILSMSDLEFGFILWIIACCFSFFVFIYELHALYLRRQFRILLGLFEFLRVVRERLKDYHDRW